jgi:hypothetical protein
MRGFGAVVVLYKLPPPASSLTNLLVSEVNFRAPQCIKHSLCLKPSLICCFYNSPAADNVQASFQQPPGTWRLLCVGGLGRRRGDLGVEVLISW